MGKKRKLVFQDDVKGKREGASPLGDDGPAAEPDDPKARKAAHLGDLLFARGRFGGAAIEYAKARRLQREEDPRLLRRLGFSELQGGRLQEAREALARAVAKDPEDSTAQVLFAQVLGLQGDFPKAEAALQAAVAQDPFDPRLHAVWLQLGRATKDQPLAAREEKVLALLSGRQHLMQSGQQGPAPHAAPPAAAAPSQPKEATP
jgi:tetratricopeptide (TPR) repeat protein